MGRFNGDRNDRGGRDSRGGGRSSFGGGRGFGRSDSGPREMFKAVCSNCGKDCEVPFRPTTGKPVYCSDCFEKMGGRNSDSARPERNDRSERPRFDRPQSSGVDNSKQFNDLNSKLDKIIALLTPKTEKAFPLPIADEVVVPTVEKSKPAKTPKVKKVKATKEAVTA